MSLHKLRNNKAVQYYVAFLGSSSPLLVVEVKLPMIIEESLLGNVLRQCENKKPVGIATGYGLDD
jgi:hypothetical protein